MAICLFGATRGCDEGPASDVAPPAPTTHGRAPAPHASADGSARPPSLDREGVEEVIRSHAAAVAARCGRPPSTEAASPLKLQLMIELDDQGAVADAAAVGGRAEDQPVRRCVEKAMRAWRFPPPGKVRTVTGTLDLPPATP